LSKYNVCHSFKSLKLIYFNFKPTINLFPLQGNKVGCAQNFTIISVPSHNIFTHRCQLLNPFTNHSPPWYDQVGCEQIIFFILLQYFKPFKPTNHSAPQGDQVGGARLHGGPARRAVAGGAPGRPPDHRIPHVCGHRHDSPHRRHVGFYTIVLFSACVAAVKSRPILHHCVVIFFWSSGIMECTCMLFTFEN